MLQDQVELVQHASHHLRAEVFHPDDILLAQSPHSSLQLLQGESTISWLTSVSSGQPGHDAGAVGSCKARSKRQGARSIHFIL